MSNKNPTKSFLRSRTVGANIGAIVAGWWWAEPETALLLTALCMLNLVLRGVTRGGISCHLR